MKEIYEALGWQGGTVHQVVKEIKRLKENAVLGEVRRHGEGYCHKEIHKNDVTGYMHNEDDDTAYLVDGIAYCGRCHCYLDKFSD